MCLECLQKMLRRGSWFWLCFITYLLGASLIACFSSKGSIELWLNARHTIFLDNLFSYTTYLGDGYFALALFICLLFVRYYEALVLLLVYLFSGALVQLLKNTIFLGEPRPKIFFEAMPTPPILHFVEGVEIHSFNSFPSGHSATAFALALFLAMILSSKHKIWGIALFLLAFLASLSRVYLLQHFFIDTVVGAFIGTIVAFFTIGYMDNRTELKEKIFWQKKLKIIS